MEMSQLIGALRQDGPVARECAVALERGVEFEVYDGTTPADVLARIYRRRTAHVERRGIEHGGFQKAVAKLEDLGPGDVRLGRVTDVSGGRHYQVFLAADSFDVLGCLWVHQGDPR